MRVAAVSGKRVFRLPWEANEKQAPFRRQDENDIFSEPLDPFSSVCSGTSFRLAFVLKLTSRFYSGRDRAGREKKSGNKDKSTPNNHLCRDWISGIPFAKAGGWKRLFRRLWPDAETETMLFGPSDPAESTGEPEVCKGELKFHHALFPDAGVATSLIGPRNEKTGTIGETGPITYEVLQPGGCCRLVIDYLPREHDPERAALVLEDLIRTAEKVHEDAIGGKSSIWGRIKLKKCYLSAGPDLENAQFSNCEKEEK